MLATRQLPAEYNAWNQRWGAPYGRRLKRILQRFPGGESILNRFPQFQGYFAFQYNNSTRVAEYPWAYNATPLSPGMRAIDLGGSLGGFQFVLAKSGLHVTNVDPGMDAHGLGWPVNQQTITRLNRAFGTTVELRNQFLQEAKLPGDHFDRLFSLSTIEHIPETEVPSLMKEIYRILKPGGFAVLTIDLFLNIAPFTKRTANEYGTNINVKQLIEYAPFELASGRRSEIYGYPEFDPERILSDLDLYLVGGYPAMAQMVTLRKPASA